MTTDEMINEMKEKYPLFTCKAISANTIQVFMGRSCSTYSSGISETNKSTFDYEHMRLEAKNKWEAKYPYLSFYIASDFLPHAIWVKREGRDAEAISYIIQGDQPYMQDIILQHFNLEAKKAIQEGWFFCSNCNEAKLQSEYAYFHFAGSYCKECEAADPEAAERARNENYE